MQRDFGLRPVIGIEIEFYLPEECDVRNSILKKEKGKNQYEIDIGPFSSVHDGIREALNAKHALQEEYPGIIFHPKPFADDYGSAMHFHINFIDIVTGANYFDDVKQLNLASSALCHYLPRTFLIFAPDESHYARYTGMMAPTHISWGNNNRSVAIRIPDLSPKRIEHRISSPETDVYLAIFTMLKSIYLGMQNPHGVEQYDKIYGNASDEQYGLQELPKSAAEALKLLDLSFFE